MTLKKNGHGLIVLKARDKGFSYMNSALCLYEWTFFQDNEVGVGASSPAYVSSFRSKIVNAWNKLPPALRLRKDLKDNENTIISGYKTKENGVWVERGNKSVIHFRCMDNPDMFRGERLGLMVFEEAGEFKELIRSYMSSQACFMDGAIQFGVPIVGGTSNMMNKENDDFMEMYYNCEKYNLKSFFIPASKAMYGYFDRKTGVSDAPEAEIYLNEKRSMLRNAKDKTAYYLYLQEYPLKPEEAFMVSNKSPFDLHRINEQRTAILQSESVQAMVQKGNLVWGDKEGEVIWHPDPDGKFHIIHHPEPGMKNLDIGGVDSYTQETAPNSVSKGSCIIYRRFGGVSDVGEMPIAQYTDRPYTKDEWYENCLKIAVYYNAKLLVEYTDEGFFNYFTKHKATKYLKERPRSADSPWSRVANRYGVHMKAYQKNLIVELIDDYIKMNCEEIYYLDLLEELANFGIKNTDRVMAFGIALLHNSDNDNVRVMRKDEKEKTEIFPHFEIVNGQIKPVHNKNIHNFNNRNTDPLGIITIRN